MPAIPDEDAAKQPLVLPRSGDAESERATEATAGSSALVRAHTRPQPARQEKIAPSLPDHLKQIRFLLELRVPIPRFTLRQLQDLTAGELLVTEQSSARELVLAAAGERLLLVELEAVELQLAARVKRLL